MPDLRASTLCPNARDWLASMVARGTYTPLQAERMLAHSEAAQQFLLSQKREDYDTPRPEGATPMPRHVPWDREISEDPAHQRAYRGWRNRYDGSE